MGFIGEIIKETLEGMPNEFLEEETGKGMAAQQCEEIIITNVIYQFASMLGGSLEFDEYGQAVIYTNHVVASQSQQALDEGEEEEAEEGEESP
jgi:hypothetical protein|tara:strand:- start:5509 stop:5787 length:279 start_codon:yes stop_codon:yes gene_type:complete